MVDCLPSMFMVLDLISSSENKNRTTITKAYNDEWKPAFQDCTLRAHSHWKNVSTHVKKSKEKQGGLAKSVKALAGGGVKTHTGASWPWQGSSFQLNRDHFRLHLYFTLLLCICGTVYVFFLKITPEWDRKAWLCHADGKTPRWNVRHKIWKHTALMEPVLEGKLLMGFSPDELIWKTKGHLSPEVAE